ncbi:MAG TPA: hypothetical protein VGK67_26345, partial [Myxococcales bacterium]
STSATAPALNSSLNDRLVRCLLFGFSSVSMEHPYLLRLVSTRPDQAQGEAAGTKKGKAPKAKGPGATSPKAALGTGDPSRLPAGSDIPWA